MKYVYCDVIRLRGDWYLEGVVLHPEDNAAVYTDVYFHRGLWSGRRSLQGAAHGE